MMSSLYLLLFFLISAISAHGQAADPDPVCLAPQAMVPTADLAGKLTGVIGADFDKSLVLDPELVETMDSRALAEMLVARLQRRCSDQRDPSKTKLSEDASEIVMLVPYIHLDRILKTGFKNQHQTNGTGGLMNRSVRWTEESRFAFMALPYTAKGRQLLPKYALQVFHGQYLGSYGLPTRYGEIMVRFKPKVKKRTTWYPSDSLGSPGPLRTQDLRPAAGTKCDGFCEAQVWGELDVSDVESIIVPKAVRDDIRRKAEEFGVPLYAYELDSLGRKAPSGIFKDTEIFQAHVDETSIYVPPPGSSAPKKIALNAPLATDELLRKVRSIDYAALGGAGERLKDEETQLIADLSARKKTPEILAALKEVFLKSSHRGTRTIALGGLYGLPWNELKPLVLPVLNSAPRYKDSPGYDPSVHDISVGSDPFLNLARMIAGEHLDDPAAVQALTSAAGPEFVRKLKENDICREEKFADPK